MEILINETNNIVVGYNEMDVYNIKTIAIWFLCVFSISSSLIETTTTAIMKSETFMECGANYSISEIGKWNKPILESLQSCVSRQQWVYLHTVYKEECLYAKY